MFRLSKFVLFFVGLALVLSVFQPVAAFAQGSEPSAQAVVCESYHRVKRGETLFKIGLLYDMSWREIAEANRLANPNRIYAGQLLCIPGEAEEPAKEPVRVPTFAILSVNRNKTVTIQTANFPANTKFVVRMGTYGTLGLKGTVVTTLDSGKGGAFQATFNIPEEMKGRNRIAIRLDGTSGYYSYNWFYNQTTR